MTTPGGYPNPDVAFVWGSGSSYGQDITEASAHALMRGETLTGYTDAQDSWKGLVSDLADLSDQVRDDQLGLNDRLDLLDGVNGYCSLFMSQNWSVAQNQLLTLPFDSQLGPAKGAEPHSDGILLKTKGLWRADAHVTADRMTSSSFSAQVYVSVMNVTSGAVFTEHQFDIVLTSSGSETAAFSHTFVIPTDDTFVVRARFQHNRNARLKVFGGTLRSALSVNKWDSRTDNALVLPDAPDGGELG